MIEFQSIIKYVGMFFSQGRIGNLREVQQFVDNQLVLEAIEEGEFTLIDNQWNLAVCGGKPESRWIVKTAEDLETDISDIVNAVAWQLYRGAIKRHGARYGKFAQEQPCGNPSEFTDEVGSAFRLLELCMPTVVGRR